jgi:hypothetical protein
MTGYWNGCMDSTHKCKDDVTTCLKYCEGVDKDIKDCETNIPRTKNSTYSCKTNRNVNGEWKSGYKTGDRWSD